MYTLGVANMYRIRQVCAAADGGEHTQINFLKMYQNTFVELGSTISQNTWPPRARRRNGKIKPRAELTRR